MAETEGGTVHGGREIPALVIGGIGIVRSLGEQGVPVYAGSDVARNHIFHSRYVRKRALCTDLSSPGFIDDMLRLAEAEGRKLFFFSDDDRAILTVARHKERLRDHYHLLLPPAETVELILDKRKFQALAADLDIPVPWSLTPASIGDLESMLNRVTYPCILKPAHREDWWTPAFARTFGRYRKTIECRHPAELVDSFTKVLLVGPPPVVQELIEGDDAQLFSVNLYFDAGGILRGFYAARKHRSYPVHAGQGCLVETVHDDDIAGTAIEIARRLDLRGLANIQFKRAPDGVLKVMEIHMRNSVWSYLGAACGMNLYYMAYLDQQGVEVSGSAGYEAGVKFMDIKRELRAIPEYWRRGEWTPGQILRSLRGRRVYHILNWRDPLPFFADLWHEIRNRFGGRRSGPSAAAPREIIRETTEVAG